MSLPSGASSRNSHFLLDSGICSLLTRSRPVHSVVSGEIPLKRAKEAWAESRAEARIKEPAVEARLEHPAVEARLEHPTIKAGLEHPTVEARHDPAAEARHDSAAKARMAPVRHTPAHHHALGV